LVVLIINLHAYLLGAVAFRATKLGGRNNYRCHGPAADGTGARHDIARRLEMREIVTAGQFLILTGIILPSLPAEPVTTLTSITPR
jgi:hypothetical protein